MNNSLKKAFFTAAMASLGVAAHAQFGVGWLFECIDPENTAPYSTPYGINGQGNMLMDFRIGVTGTVTYGGPNGPCYGPPGGPYTLNALGRFAYGTGTEGSIQDTAYGGLPFDNSMALTVGWPNDPVGNFAYATLTRNGTRTLFGSAGMALLYTGLSNRYLVAETTIDSTRVRLNVDVFGDAIRQQWTLTNLGTEAAGLGLWFGAYTGMRSNLPDPQTGANQSHSFLGTLTGNPKPGYVTVPVGRPPMTDRQWIRATDPIVFPAYVDFHFGQTSAYGMRVENGPTPATSTESGQSDATEVAEFMLGKHTFLLGAPGDQTFPGQIIPDTDFRGSTSFIQKYAETQVGPGAARTIVQYIRSTWGNSNYTLPYTVVVDAPPLIGANPNDPNELLPNPMIIRVYVDNVGGFSFEGRPIPLNDVRVTMSLPPGMRFAPGQEAVKMIPVVPPRLEDPLGFDHPQAGMRFVDYEVEVDGTTFGELFYQVRVEPTPGPTKQLTGRIVVAATPKLRLQQGANLVTTPFVFADNSWASILGLMPGTDFRAFTWDPIQNGYIVSTNAERGRAHWIVVNQDYGLRTLQGDPQQPDDVATGAGLVHLRQGWNLIGNPYNYAIPLGQITGVAGADPSTALTWQQLVQQGYVSGALAYWDQDQQAYRYIQGNDALMLPNRGYWIYVFTPQPVTLSYPPVFEPFMPGSFRSTGPTWAQTEKQWRLQLVARTASWMDDQNFIGQAPNAGASKELRIMKPPMSPVQDVAVSIEDAIDGRPTRLAQALHDSSGRKEWKVMVDVKEPGSVTLTWPNMSTVPKNIRFRLIDTATNTTRDMRQTSGYTFEANEATTREFKIQVEPGTAQRAIIGNVVVSRPSRDANAPFTISYTLSAEATTTVRILNSAGREVFAVTRGRSDSAGENTVTWALRDKADRAVAPGTYRVEIIAETETGDRVRSVVPINVIR
jgi:hypothetical protein